jgi:hypothetical protein
MIPLKHNNKTNTHQSRPIITVQEKTTNLRPLQVETAAHESGLPLMVPLYSQRSICSAVGLKT